VDFKRASAKQLPSPRIKHPQAASIYNHPTAFQLYALHQIHSLTFIQAASPHSTHASSSKRHRTMIPLNQHLALNHLHSQNAVGDTQRTPRAHTSNPHAFHSATQHPPQPQTVAH
jgi:hypothetical protein